MHFIWNFFHLFYFRVPDGLEDVSKFPKLFSSLLEDGWNEVDLKKLAGSNIMRVLDENDKVFLLKNFHDDFQMFKFI